MEWQVNNWATEQMANWITGALNTNVKDSVNTNSSVQSWITDSSWTVDDKANWSLTYPDSNEINYLTWNTKENNDKQLATTLTKSNDMSILPSLYQTPNKDIMVSNINWSLLVPYQTQQDNSTPLSKEIVSWAIDPTKQSKSWKWVDPNFYVSMWDTWDVLDILSDPTIQMFTNAAWQWSELPNLIKSLSTQYNSAKNKWQAQEIAGQLKVALADMAQLTYNKMYWQLMNWWLSTAQQEHMNALTQYNTKVQWLKNIFDSTWDLLVSQAQKSMVPTTITKYVDPTHIESRRAKDTLRTNSYRQAFLTSTIKTASPFMYNKLVKDMSEDTITDSEKQFLWWLQWVIKSYKNQRNETWRTQWWDIAKSMYDNNPLYKSIIELDGIWYKTLLSDIQDDAYKKIFWWKYTVEPIWDELYTSLDPNKFQISSWMTWYNYDPVTGKSVYDTWFVASQSKAYKQNNNYSWNKSNNNYNNNKGWYNWNIPIWLYSSLWGQ